MRQNLAWACLLFTVTAAPGLMIPTLGDDGEASRGEVVLRGLDPVSLLEGVEQKGDEQFSTTRGRFRYLFATAEHKARFDAKPEHFAVQSEHCAVMPKAPGSPDLFLVHEGKIYLFGSPACRTSFQNDPEEFLEKEKAPRKNVAIFVYSGMELLDFAGPGEVFAVAGQGRAFDVFTVAASPEPVTSQGFVAITPRYTINDCPKVDLLVIPGGSTRIPQNDPAVIDWLRKVSADAEVSLSVCTGAFLLAKAGLLDGLEATTHQSAMEGLKQAAPSAKIVAGRRFVDNGKIVTSAGVSAGIDGALHVVKRLLGDDAANETARYMEYDWKPEAESR